ncbi:hypothetical protein IEQ34_027083 [Dendrobium chrysotoxum]|uniref:Uncharacterized protein n=1 Tax=Dendrobium chrysotoxum TaxID=161865 RepID=A0AAV7FH20_DENCH|nr:hypothetical protein IEQ34_027083 [Dendrobium chrysotoxum]
MFVVFLGGCVGGGLAFVFLVSFLDLLAVEAIWRSAYDILFGLRFQFRFSFTWVVLFIRMVFVSINEGDVYFESLFWVLGGLLAGTVVKNYLLKDDLVYAVWLTLFKNYLMVTVDSLAPARLSPVIILIYVGNNRLIWLPMLRCFNLHRGGPAGYGKNERIDIFVFFLFWKRLVIRGYFNSEKAEEDPMVISSSARVLERKLVVRGRTILSSVPGNVISSSIVSSGPVEVFFLGAQLSDLSSGHVVSLGILRWSLFLKCGIHSLWNTRILLLKRAEAIKKANGHLFPEEIHELTGGGVMIGRRCRRLEGPVPFGVEARPGHTSVGVQAGVTSTYGSCEIACHAGLERNRSRIRRTQENRMAGLGRTRWRAARELIVQNCRRTRQEIVTIWEANQGLEVDQFLELGSDLDRQLRCIWVLNCTEHRRAGGPRLERRGARAGAVDLNAQWRSGISGIGLMLAGLLVESVQGVGGVATDVGLSKEVEEKHAIVDPYNYPKNHKFDKDDLARMGIAP